MNYTKPQVTVMGEAVRVIQSPIAKPGSFYDGVVHGIPNPLVGPAYDLDE
jgi:hypothetical protein